MPAGAGKLDEGEAERLRQVIWKELSWFRAGACQSGATRSGEVAHSYLRPSAVYLFIFFSLFYFPKLLCRGHNQISTVVSLFFGVGG